MQRRSSSPKNLFLQGIFVADVEDPPLGTGNKPGEGHSFDDEVRKVAEDEAILDGAGLRFRRRCRRL